MFDNVPGMPQKLVSRPGAEPLTPVDVILKHPPLILGPGPVKAPMAHPNLLDSGVYNNRLLKIRIRQRDSFGKLPDLRNLLTRPGLGEERIQPVKEGTYEGVKAVVSETYSRLEHGFDAAFAAIGVEPIVPRMLAKPERLQIYQFSEYPKTDTNKVEYPPHLDIIPKGDVTNLWDIFNFMGMMETAGLIKHLVPIDIAWKWPDAHWPWGEKTKDVYYDAYCEANKKNFIGHKQTDIESDPGLQNIGYLNDWFSDRRFAEQSLTGTSPATLTKVGDDLLKEFIDAAQDTGASEWAERLKTADPASLFVQDGRYLRKAVGVAPDAELKHKSEDYSEVNWACCAVTLFELHGDGKLHPAAIVCDYKADMRQSVTIFNKKIIPTDVDADQDVLDAALKVEEEDWPWRYAKTCAQVTDWIKHEVGVHLTHSHFVEEVIVVASKRCFDEDHPVYRLLSPHWIRTLSLNAAARTTLVPSIVSDIVGMSLPDIYKLIRYEFDNYNFVDNYVPNNLKKRGFPSTPKGLEDPKYKNYAYAKDIILMWDALRKFVMSTLKLEYASDETVVEDSAIQEWCNEIQTLGAMPSFPSIRTLDELADAITMCIHIAAPFHTAVNYLQNFYQAFVFSKPPALCAPMPKDLYELQHYTKEQFASALHIERHRQWLLAEQLTWLLSFKVEKACNLETFAQSHQLLAGTDAEEKASLKIIDELATDLAALTAKFRENSLAMDKHSIPYTVLEPSNTAVSILI